MSDPTKVHTIAGPFDQTRLDALKVTIQGEAKDALVNFESQELHVGFAQFLVQYVESELSKRNGGL